MLMIRDTGLQGLVFGAWSLGVGEQVRQGVCDSSVSRFFYNYNRKMLLKLKTVLNFGLNFKIFVIERI